MAGPEDTTLKEWDKHKRAAAERRVSDEVGLSLEQLETIKQWDLRAMAKRAFLFFVVPEDTLGFIQARSRTTIGFEYLPTTLSKTDRNLQRA
jgi:hypothetical protein